MVDWSAHYDTIYAALGVAGTIEIADSDAVFNVTLIDKTGGIQVSEDPSVASIKPAAVVRVYELASLGIARAFLTDGTVTLNGASFQITGTLPRPAPTGEAGGELFLILREFE
jgi:hypothetical protein